MYIYIYIYISLSLSLSLSIYIYMHMLRGRRGSAAAAPPRRRHRDVLVLNTGGACPAPAKCAYPPAWPAKCAFPSLLVVFVWLLYTKNQRPAPPVIMQKVFL